MNRGHCRACSAALTTTFVDLGMSPLSNAFLRPSQLGDMEPFFPLHVYVCDNCRLVQLEEYEAPSAIFGKDYAYFSSYSDTWLRHARDYATSMVEQLGLGGDSLVVEIGSNDGYLLQYFREASVPVLGIEPAESVAAEATRRGIPTWISFFGREVALALAGEGRLADLIVGNNVLAHVPDLNDFVSGLAIALKPTGVVTFEFPHLVRLVEGNQWDTIYHEHYSYLSLYSVERVFNRHGLSLYDVAEIDTHGGSLRIFVRHSDAGTPPSTRLSDLRHAEKAVGIDTPDFYRGFRARVEAQRWEILDFLIGARRAGKRVAGYGAPAKATTLLNYCGVRSDLLPYTVDRSPHKQGLFMPGVRVPIEAPSKIERTRPDYLVIMPWNLRSEIESQMCLIHDWGGRFVVFIPKVEVWP